MTKINWRKNYYLTIDAETVNSLDDPLVYGIRGVIHDKKGKVYETFSFMVYDIFVSMKDFVKTVYYAKKIPTYENDLRAGLRKIVRYDIARKHIVDLCEKYDVRAIITQRDLTCSKYRQFLPYGIEVWNTFDD
jgi:hypothetical protein